jgi:hypothetical protein
MGRVSKGESGINDRNRRKRGRGTKKRDTNRRK